MDPKSKLQHQERTELQAEVHAQSATPGQVFENVEELLRHDAAQTQPPPQLQVRLAQSIEKEPTPSRPWWKRILRSS